MNLVADEGLDYPILLALRKEGHFVYSVLENLAAALDEDVLKIANQQNSVLITTDKDFGELVYRLNKISSGIILLRLEGLDMSRKIQLVLSAVQMHENEFANSFTVITGHNIRIRRLK